MSEKLNHYKRAGVFLILVALMAGTIGCLPSSQRLEIRTWSDLDSIRDNFGKTYVLLNDLDSTNAGYDELAGPAANGGKGWQPIGTRDASFYGHFDGQGHEVRDLFINRPTEGDVGLFGAVYNKTTIDNLGVVNADVTGQSYVGIVAGINYGAVGSCYSSGNVTGETYVGVLVGGSADTIDSSYSVGSATGSTLIGGLLGGNTGTVGNSYSLASAIGDSRVGGLIGGNGGTASNCYSAGSVGGNDDIGGLVGADFVGTVTNSFWDLQSSGQTISAGGTGKATAEMQDIAIFSAAGWNIVAVGNVGERNSAYIWDIVSGVTYPFLSWQP
jgi:hypothetical protein